MRTTLAGFAFALCVSAMLVPVGAQERPASNDPRVGLKGGFRDAGVASRNMELIANLPKPEGFFDPRAPAGSISAPEPPPGTQPERPANATPANATPPGPPTIGSGFTNSDLPFRGNNVV